jgi:hypothetical protein
LADQLVQYLANKYSSKEFAALYTLTQEDTSTFTACEKILLNNLLRGKKARELILSSLAKISS